MNCTQARENIVDDAIDDLTRAHVDGCEACRELSVDDGRLARALASQRLDGLSAPGFDELLAATQQDDDEAVWRLRSMPTPRRIALAIAISLFTFGGMFLLARRADWASYPALQMTLVLLSMLVAVAVAVTLSMPAVYRPARRTSTRVGALVALLAVPFLPALLPVTDTSTGGGVLIAFGKCLGLGTLAAIPAFFAIRTLQRNRSWGVWPTIFAAIAGAVAANMALQVHCPISDGAHIATSHAIIGVLYVGLAWAIVQVKSGSRAGF